jgi:signal peptidase I
LAQDFMIEYYYNYLINHHEEYKQRARKMLAEEKIAHQNGNTIKHFGVVYRPVDERENYIKRCVGIAGDWLEIKGSKLYVNGKPAFVSEFQNAEYIVTNYEPRSSEVMREKYGLEQSRGDYELIDGGKYLLNVTQQQLEKLETDNPKATFELKLEPQYSDKKGYKPKAVDLVANINQFPKDFYVNNTVTDFTKFQIPKKGQKIAISLKNIAWYRRIITAYEGHKLQETKAGIFIDGKKASTYTFKMNYYWMMGDNRYKSADSRVWGFVPEDHIVGRASLVWFSKSADPAIGIRWERLFKFIH